MDGKKRPNVGVHLRQIPHITGTEFQKVNWYYFVRFCDICIKCISMDSGGFADSAAVGIIQKYCLDVGELR